MALPEIYEARIDWISCSANETRRADQLAAIGNAGIERQMRAGDRRAYFGGHGYKGSQAGHWKCAVGPDGVMVQVGGSEAATWSRSLLGTASHVSRIDYQVTTIVDDTDYNPAASIYSLIKDEKLPTGKTPGAKHIQQTDDGTGVSIGSRAGAYNLRVYNKHVESKGEYPEGAWRWEVEMKRHASEAEHQALRCDYARLDRAAQLVGAAFDRWEIPRPWHDDATITLHKAPKHLRDAERALNWLRSQVAPTVEWLIASGLEREVREALNLG